MCVRACVRACDLLCAGQVLADFLRAEDATLVAHLESLQVAPSVVTTPWILTAFVGSAIPLAALLRVWDTFLTHRHVTFLFRLAVPFRPN